MRFPRCTPARSVLVGAIMHGIRPKPRSDAMDARVHRPLHNRSSSTFDWIMLAFSFLTVGWIVVAY
jgi:hypothetical protein